MKIMMYWLNKHYRKFRFKYYKIMRTIEITIYFWNIIIYWGKNYEIKN